jgi:hypothetical protein
MEVLGEDSLGLEYKNNSVLFDKKNRSHYFYIEYNKFKTAVVAIFIKESLVQRKAHFLRISGYDIARARDRKRNYY